MQVSARTYSQTTVTLSRKGASVKAILDEIQRQAGYTYILNTSWVSQMKPIIINVRNEPVEAVLDQCFKNQPYTYTIINTTIIVKQREEGNKASPNGGAPPPGQDIKGKVVSDKGEPVPGASVFLRGTNKGTNTDDNGDFVLKNIQDAGMLEIRSVGYYDTVMVVNEAKYLFVKLRTKIAELGQAAVIAVSNGYQKIPKDRATGSFSFVDKELFNRRVSGDILGRLEGVVPGVLFNRNTSDGEISIRGRSTLFANASPLIVVDNFPYDGDLNNINPNDVENITILKDAAAASIWGVQSGNGVIVITTKRGRRNLPLTVDANVNTTLAGKPNLHYNPNFLSSKDFIDVERNLFGQGYYDAQLTNSNNPAVSPVVQLLADARSGKISQAEADKQISTLSGYDERDDLSKYFYRQAVRQQYAVSIRGGSDKNAYVFSVGYDKNLDDRCGNKNDRITLNGNSDFYLVKNLVFTAGLYYTQANSTLNSPVANIVTGGQYTTTIYPYSRLADDQGKPLAIVKDYNYSWVTDPVAQAGLMNWQYRPLDELNYADNTSKAWSNMINLGLSYNLPLGFKISTLYKYEKAKTDNQNYYSDSTYYARNMINSFTDPASMNRPIPIGGILQQNQTTSTSNRLRAQLEYNHIFSRQHQLIGIVGAEGAQSIVENNTPAFVYGYDKNIGSYQNVDYVSYFTTQPALNSSQIPSGISFYKSNNRYISYYSNLAYTFDHKYTLSASGRIDKSNLFGVKTNQKSVPLYSIGAGWEVSREKFYHANWLPYLKFRATYGYNGNINTSATAVTTISHLNNSYFFGQPYSIVDNPGNPQLRWEKIQMINVGLDYGLVKNVVSGGIDFFFKRGKDMFGNSPLPPSTGVPVFFGNTADIKGNGFDLSFNIQAFNSKSFKWTSVVICSYALDKITKYDVRVPMNTVLLAGASSGSIAPEVGKPIFSIYAFPFAGLSHDKGDPQGYLAGKVSTDYRDIIGTATVDSLQFIGSARPTTYGSWTNTFSYKGFTLSANIIYKLNYYFKRTSIGYNSLFSLWNAHKDYQIRWTTPGDEEHTSVPSMPTSVAALDVNRDMFYLNSSALVTKGDHIRLQDIRLSYDFKTGKLFNNVIKSLRLYGYTNNVAILWRANREKLDPDVYGVGSYPLPRTYAVGLNVIF